MKGLISGAAGMHGEAVRTEFLQQGATVSCTARSHEGVDAAGASWFPCENHADETAARAAASRAMLAMGGIDALVHVYGAFS